MYLPDNGYDQFHAYMYPLGVVYARTQAEADEHAAECGLDQRSGMWWNK